MDNHFMTVLGMGLVGYVAVYWVGRAIFHIIGVRRE